MDPWSKAGQHEMSSAALPKACKLLASGHLTLLIVFALPLRLGTVRCSDFTLHGSGDHAFPKRLSRCPSLHKAAAWASKGVSLWRRKERRVKARCGGQASAQKTLEGAGLFLAWFCKNSWSSWLWIWATKTYPRHHFAQPPTKSQ